MKPMIGAGAAILALGLSGLASADDDASKNEAFQRGWYVTPMFSHTNADSARGAGSGSGPGLAIGHRGDVAAIELDGIYTALEGDAELEGAALDLLIGAFEHPWLGHLFGLVGFGTLEEKNVPALQKPHSSAYFGEVGLGGLIPFEVFGIRPAARVEFRYRYDYEQPPVPDNTPNTFKDWVLNVGLQIPLTPPPPPPPPPTPPPPARVVPLAPQSPPAAQPGESTAQPENPTAQPAAESSAPATSESSAPAPPASQP